MKSLTVYIFDQQINNRADIGLRQWLEHNDLIQPVQKFRSEMSFQVIHCHFLTLFVNRSVFFDALQQIICSDIGGHDQDRILEIDRASLRICDSSVIKYL